MKEDAIAFMPEIISVENFQNWDYDKSVTKVRQLVYKWKNITPELYKELIIAQGALSRSGNPNWRKSAGCNQNRTWSSYCIAIGSSKSVVNKWIAIWKTKKLREDKQRKFAQLTDHYDCLLYTSPSPRD